MALYNFNHDGIVGLSIIYKTFKPNCYYCR